MSVAEGLESWELGDALWSWPALAVVAVVAVAIALVLRERHHRRRREELQARLADLESILIGITIVPARPASGGSGSASFSQSSSVSEDELPRGPLSTAISMLRSGLGPGLPGPDRIDLRATFFVYEHLEQPLTPSELAEGLNLSLRSLQRGLSGSLGCTPRELILAVKMREAKRRMVEEGLRVQEAARAVGFDDPFHFSRRFKAYYQIAPSELHEAAGRSVA